MKTAFTRQSFFGLAAIGALAILFSGDRASAEFGAAQTKLACCQLTTSLASQYLRGSDVPGDERFFKTEAAPPNIHFLFDNSGSMRFIAQVDVYNEAPFFNSDPANNGCSNTYLIAYQTAKGWDPNTETGGAPYYPYPDQGTGLGSDNGPYTNLWRPDYIYAYYIGWPTSGFSPSVAYTNKTAACKGLWPSWASSQATQYNRCLTCLNTRGFYKKTGVSFPNDSAMIFTGNMMNFNPTRAVSARAVLKQVVKDMRRVRMGLTVFDGSSGGNMIRAQNPACNLSLSEGSNFDNNRASIVNSINGLTFSSSTPLAESLLNVGQYFCSDNKRYTNSPTASAPNIPGFGFSSSYIKSAFNNGSLSGQQRSVCWGCQVSSVVIITDGRPDGDNSLPRSQIFSRNGGQVRCDNDAFGNNLCADLESSQDDMLDDVAKLLYTQDLQITIPPVTSGSNFNSAGQQSLITYTIGFGVDHPILANAARYGGGEYYVANDADELRDRILAVVSQVETRATSFAAASVSSLQVNRTGGSLLPRFRPSRLNNKPWTGYLYRFELGAETITQYGGAFCDPAKAATILTGGAGDPNDLNMDGDCDDLNLIDIEDDAVVEDDDGVFRKALSPLEVAKPYWEASAVMKPTTGMTQHWQTRHIYTVVDSNNDNRLDWLDTPIEFSVANAATLRMYMGIPNTANPCPDLSSALGYVTPPLTPNQCAEWVIKWYRGADIFNADPGRRDYDREHFLQDIFHSSPVVVEPPSSKFLCGITGQCTQTLFGTKTPLKDYSGIDAYDKWVQEHGKRDKVVLVGSNSGMLHAFHNGNYLNVNDPYLEQPIYDQGSGTELWAFVPPDQLPKLLPNIDRQAYFVDGTPMVRDVWLNGVGADAVGSDQIKQWTEFRTVAVTGYGIGGTHRFALDITRLLPNPGDTFSDRSVIITKNVKVYRRSDPLDPDSPVSTTPTTITLKYSPPSQAGDFRWLWPQPCDAEALVVGDSYGNFSPKPPPLGAVAIANAAGPLQVNSVKAEERWIGFFNGGWDPYLARGRGLAMVDLKEGNTLWQYWHGESKANADDMKYPFVAVPSMMDLGNSVNAEPDRDLLFDTATVGDYGGNIWTVRFWQPGTIVSGKVTNWFAARAFRPSGASDNAVRQPITFMTSNALQPSTGYLRTYVGTGDRFNMLDKDGPLCRLSNPYACAQLGCTVRNTVRIDRGPASTQSTNAQYASKAYSTSTTALAAAGNACSGARMKLTWDYDSTGSCGQNSAGTLEYVCSGTTSTWTCSKAVDNWDKSAYQATAPTTSPDKFFGFWSYGGSSSTRRFNTSAEALTYDTAFGSNTRPMSEGDLTHLTSNTVSADKLGNGWYLSYGHGETPGRPDERTGSGSTVLDGCVLWNSFEAIEGGSTICATSGENVARFYQANYVTGSPNCAESFQQPDGGYDRYIERTVVAIPGEPNAQRTISAGQGASTIVTLEAGLTQGNTVSESSELVQSIYQLEVDHTEHACRHAGDTSQCK